MSAYYDNIADIQEIFTDFGSPKWSLYSGKGKMSYPTGRAEFANLLKKQSEDLDLRQSWDVLNSYLIKIAKRGGYAHLYLGNELGFTNAPIYFPHVGETAGQTQSAALAGIGMPYDFQTALQKERELWELRSQMDRLLEGMESRSSIWERVGEKLLENEQLPAMITGIIGAFANMAIPKIGVNQRQANPIIPANIPDNEPQTGQGFEEKVGMFFQNSRERDAFLKKVLNLFQADPEGMKNLVEHVSQQIENE